MKKLSLIILLILCLICFKVYAGLDVEGITKVLGFQMLLGSGEGKVLTSDVNGIGTWRSLNVIGNITDVVAGYGLLGGGNYGSVSLAANPDILQNRVFPSGCSANSSIRQINQDGSVICEADDVNIGTITGVFGSNGVSGSGTSGSVTLSADITYLQKRVSGSCATGISVINADGTVSCESATVGDNLGNHTAIQNIRLNNYYLSNDGGSEGVSIDNSGVVRVTGFKMTTGAGTNKVLTSNSSGVGSWQNPTAVGPGYWLLSGSDISNTNSGDVSVLTNLQLPASTSTIGIIYSGSNKFIHSPGTANTFVGISAGNALSSGTHNSASGAYALASLTSGTYNTAIGAYALTANNNSHNTAVGAEALRNSTGEKNTALGSGAGYNSTGSRNVFLGFEAGYNAGSSSDKLYIANSRNDPPLIYGDFSSGRVGIGTVTLTDKLNVDGTVQMTGFKLTTGAVAGRVLTVANAATGEGTWQSLPSPLISVSGTPTPNYLAKFTPDATHIGNSLISDNGTTVAIGTLNAGLPTKFQVQVGAIYGYVSNADGSWATSSDIRLKKNITTLEDTLGKLLNIRGVRYNFKTEPDSNQGGGRHIGFIAQELEQEFPELVDTDKEGYKSVSYESITPVLVEAIKALKAENDALKKRIEALELSGDITK